MTGNTLRIHVGMTYNVVENFVKDTDYKVTYSYPTGKKEDLIVVFVNGEKTIVVTNEGIVAKKGKELKKVVN